MNEKARQFGQGSYLALKTATRQVVKACGGLESAESLSRIGRAHISRCYDPSTDHFLPIDVVADLEESAGMMPVTATLARLHGCKLQSETGDSGTTADLTHSILTVAGNLGEASAQLREMDADGHRSINELEQAIAIVSRLSEAVNGYSQALHEHLADLTKDIEPGA